MNKRALIFVPTQNPITLIDFEKLINFEITKQRKFSISFFRDQILNFDQRVVYRCKGNVFVY